MERRAQGIDGLLVVQIFGIPLVPGALIQVLSETHHARFRLSVRMKKSPALSYTLQDKMIHFIFSSRHSDNFG